MKTVKENFSLIRFNTFGVDVSCKYFADIGSEKDIQSLISDKKYSASQKFVLGGGSNILFTKDFDGIVMHNCFEGIGVVSVDDDYAFVKAGAGEIWHQLVLYSIGKNFGGIENLSLIPGYVGAAPIQNIGAYGAELKNVFHSLTAVDLSSGEQKIFSADECHFGYRDSIFKREAKNKFMITDVTLRLKKHPLINTTYGAIEKELTEMKISSPTIRDVSNAVIKIRQSKLPDPKVISNCGSFFKNPTVPMEKYLKLKSIFPEVVAYPAQGDTMKLSSGWMIEQCGWKGKKVGNVGMHKDQALVLVNYGNADGRELLTHAAEVQKSVKENFGIVMEAEVNVL
ncbi:MAG: UDP-N-acetylmuramate dehydrogenase [Bacteroidia bacterium]|nr:UDP-N-acetylmuramate dehydrogenase [Bacteroidia bacterium]